MLTSRPETAFGAQKSFLDLFLFSLALPLVIDAQSEVYLHFTLSPPPESQFGRLSGLE